MIRFLGYLLFMICFFTVGSVRAQDFPMLHYSTDEGLPSNTIYNIYRDSKGYLWIATDKGVSRFNGIRFENYSTFNGLPDNEIFFFREDNYGRLWLATYNGDLCYYKDDSFHTKKNTPFLNLGKTISYIRRISIMPDSTVVFYYWNGFKILSIKNEKIWSIDFTDNIPDNRKNSIFSIEKLLGERYKFFFVEKYSVFDSSKKIVEEGPIYYDQDSGRTWGSALSQERVYQATRHSIFAMPEVKIVKTLPDDFSQKYKLVTACFSGMQVMLGTDKGLLINDTLHVLKDCAINTINKDTLGNYWLGTAANGIFVLNKNFHDTKIHLDAYEGKITYTFQDKEQLFFCTKNNRVYSLVKGKVSSVVDYNRSLKNFKSDAFIHGFYIDSNYRFYDFSNSWCVSVDNLSAGKKRMLKYPGDIPTTFTINEVIGVGRKLFLNVKSRIFSVDLSKYRDGETLKYELVSDPNINERIYCMAKAPDNCIWYSYADTVYKIENGVSRLQRQFPISFKWFGFFSEFMVGYTHDNRLFICRNYNSDSIQLYPIEQRRCIWDKIYQVDSVHLLIQTNNLYRMLTLNRHNLDSSRIWAIENQFLPLQAEAVTTDGKYCYFFKNGSITSIEAGRLFEQALPPQLFFTGLKTSANRFIHIQNEMELSYKNARNITISFSTNSFGGKDVTYEFSASKSEQDNWREIKSEELNLVNPGYGTYLIKVRARSTSSEKSRPIIFTLHILRPYWATWWFISLCIFAGLAITGIVIRFRIIYAVRKNKKEHETEIKFMKSEYKAINALMNPHFIFNTLNNVQSLFNANDKLAANEYLRIFADLIRQNMYNVTKELIPLQREVALVVNYLMLEKLRFEDKLNYNINVDEDIDLSDVMVPPLLLQPLVENSLKHGILPLKDRNGIIEVNIFQKNDILHIEVRDNGLGLNQAKEAGTESHESFGMGSINKRIAQLSIIQNKKITFSMSEIKDRHGNHLWTVGAITMPLAD